MRSIQPRIPARFKTMKRTRKAFAATIPISTIMAVRLTAAQLNSLRSDRCIVESMISRHFFGQRIKDLSTAWSRKPFRPQGPAAERRFHNPASRPPERLSRHSVSVPARFCWCKFPLSPRNASMAERHEPAAPSQSCEYLGPPGKKASAAPGESVFHCHCPCPANPRRRRRHRKNGLCRISFRMKRISEARHWSLRPFPSRRENSANDPGSSRFSGLP